MIKISSLVEQVIQADDIAREALELNILNLSAYANRIKPQIETRLYKPVTTGSIVIALSRLRNKIKDLPDLYPKVVIDNISVKSPLAELSYEKTQDTIKSTSKLRPEIFKIDAFFTVTQGVNEITIICPKPLSDTVKKHFKVNPRGFYDNLASVTVKFVEADYIEVPNMIFSLVRTLASRRINIIEIVSTFTELSFIIRDRDLQDTVSALSPLFPKTI